MESPGEYCCLVKTKLYGPPPMTNRNQSKDVFVRFFVDFFICNLVCKSFLNLIHHFAKVVKQKEFTLNDFIGCLSSFDFDGLKSLQEFARLLCTQYVPP